jgi:hypothetical protein
MIISLPVHTAVWNSRLIGAFEMLVAVQVSSVQRLGVAVGVIVGVAVGVALGVVVGVAVGSGVGVGVGPDCAQYLPPVFKTVLAPTSPPQTIISLPVQTAV